MDATQSQSKSLQTFQLQTGYGFFSVGVQARSLPVLVASGTNTLSWDTLTTISPVAGIHLEKEYLSPKHHKFTIEADLNASKPVSGSGDVGGVQASGLSGFGAGASFGAKKTILNSDACKIRLGLDVSADYLHLSYTGASGNNQGAVTQSFQEYSTKLGVEFEF